MPVHIWTCVHSRDNALQINKCAVVVALAVISDLPGRLLLNKSKYTKVYVSWGNANSTENRQLASMNLRLQPHFSTMASSGDTGRSSVRLRVLTPILNNNICTIDTSK
jgi:hypothetical protein